MEKIIKRTFTVLIVSIFIVLSFSTMACSKKDEMASLKSDIPKSFIVGGMIDFNNYISYQDGVDIKVSYQKEDGTVVNIDSMYFQTYEVGKNDFNFIFSKDGASKKIELEVNIVALAPDVIVSNNGINYSLGTNKSFDDIFEDSGIIATPANYLTIDFISVDYYEENLSVENYSLNIKNTELKNKNGFTFDKTGTYIFHINIFNNQGSYQTDIQVSVFDYETEGIANTVNSGVLFGEKVSDKDTQNTIKLVKPGSNGSLSYLAFNEEYLIEADEFYCIDVEFAGINAPNLIFFADSITGKTDSGNGIYVSLEEDVSSGLSIFAPGKLSGSVSAFSDNSFGVNTLRKKCMYKWKTIITKIDDSKMAIKSILFVYNTDTNIYQQLGVFNWQSFNYGANSGYILIAGSKNNGDIICRISEPYKCDYLGVKI